MTTKKILTYIVSVLCLAGLCYLLTLRSVRYDMTADKRYSLSQPTERLLGGMTKPIEVIIYLDGELNAGFLRLRDATADLLDEMDAVSAHGLTYRFHNPHDVADPQQHYQELAARGLTPTVIYDKDKSGNNRQILVFPWAELKYGGKTIAVSLLKNVRGQSGEENLNASIETLEYEITDALRMLVKKGVRHVAFLEGHGELPEAYTYDLTVALSRYFQVDRGVLQYDASVLDGFEAVIIAGPKQAFSERDKFIIDQYIMRGGKVLWMLDGVRFDYGSLSTEGLTPAIALDLNLTDMLFHYGIRVNAGLLQDEQCLPVPVNVAPQGQNPDYQPIPWHYQPLLLPSPLHPASSHTTQVIATFPSTLDFVGSGSDVEASLLLVSSEASRVIPTPAKVDLMPQRVSDEDFPKSYLPVGAMLEGQFTSAFSHRIAPDSIVNAAPFAPKSVKTKMAVFACGSLARNDVENSQVVPLGFDRYTQTQFGNRDLLLNTILYLTDDAGWIQLRQKQFTLRLLNTTAVRRSKTMVQVTLIVVPAVLLLIFGVVYNLLRRPRRKSTKD